MLSNLAYRRATPLIKPLILKNVHSWTNLGLSMRNFMEKTTGYWAGARRRAQRRKSPWNLVLIPLCGGSAIAIWYALFRLVWWFHAMLYPGHQLPDFWR